MDGYHHQLNSVFGHLPQPFKLTGRVIANTIKQTSCLHFPEEQEVFKAVEMVQKTQGGTDPEEP